MGKRIRKSVLELISELPQVGIEKGHHRESGRPNPYVEEAIRTGMRHSWVSSVCISKVLLHRLRRLASTPLLYRPTLLQARASNCFLYNAYPRNKNGLSRNGII